MEGLIRFPRPQRIRRGAASAPEAATLSADYSSHLHPAAGPDGGTALFGALGLLASIPMLARLYRRFGSWIAPALGLLVFAAMFSLSAFVIGPAISGTGGEVNPGPVPTVDHTADH